MSAGNNYSAAEYEYQVPVAATSPWPLFRRDHKNTGRSCIAARYSGDQPWFFQTGKGIFSTPVVDGNGTVYIGSADHRFYAISAEGRQKWHYYTGAPIRSSPAVGRCPDGEPGDTVYFGGGNGKLYAINTRDGSRRWSFDTTPQDADARDRNELNGSPALGQTGIYIGGEHGQLWYLPYDYCLHVDDKRASRAAGEDLPADCKELVYVSPGGKIGMDPPTGLPAATLLTLRLVVRRGGRTIDARLSNAFFRRSRKAL